MRLLVAVTISASLAACGISQDQHRMALDNQKQTLMGESDQRAAALQAEIDALKAETARLSAELVNAKAAAGEAATSNQALQQKISGYEVAITAATTALNDGLAAMKKKDPKGAETKFGEAANTLANAK